MAESIIRVVYQVDDSELQSLPVAEKKIQATGAAAAATSPQIEAMAAAMRASKTAAKEEAAALGLTVTEHKKVQREAAKTAEVVRKEAARREAAEGKAAAAVSRGVTGIGHQLSDVASQLSTGTNPFTILIQQGPQIAGVLGEMGIGMAVVAKGAAVLVAGVASLAAIGVTLYGTLGLLSDAIGPLAGRLTGLELEPVTEAMRNQREAAAILAKSYEDMGPILDDTREKQRLMRVELGLITEEQANVEKSAEDAFNRYNTAVEGTRLKLVELRKEQASVGTQLVDSAEKWMPAWTPLGYAVRNLTDSSADLQVEIDASNQAMGEQAAALAENAHLGKRLIAVTEGNKRAEEERRDGLKDSSRAMKDYAHDLEEVTRALAKFADIQRAAEAATRITVTELEGVGTTGAAKVYADLAVDIQKLTEKQAEVVAGLEEEQKKALESAHTHEQRAKIVFAALDAISAVETQYAQERITASEQAEVEVTEILAEQEEVRLKAAEDGLKARQDLAEKQADIAKKAADDARKAAEAQRDMVNQALHAAQQVAAAIGEVFARQQAKAEEALAATRSELDQIAGLLEGLSMVTVDAAALSGDALVQAYTSGQVAAEDLSTSQKLYLQQQLQQEQDAAKKREQAQKDAALASWEAQHATALAMALINIPLAISQALASAPYPANLVFAGISGGLAAGAAIAVAAEKPPSFRAGYMPDQRLAMIEPQSEIVAPASAVQAMGGQEAAQKAFAGVAPSGGVQITQFKLGHRLFNEQAKDARGRPGVFRDLTKKPSTGSRRPYG